MFRRILAIFFILSNLNASMLLPQADALGYTDQCAAASDNINSLAEYINEILLGNPDDPGDDQNADQDFHYAKQIVYNYQVPETRVQSVFTESCSHDFGEAVCPEIISPDYDVIIPPPKIA